MLAIQYFHSIIVLGFSILGILKFTSILITCCIHRVGRSGLSSLSKDDSYVSSLIATVTLCRKLTEVKGTDKLEVSLLSIELHAF